jgi:hypothetical protein
MKRLILTTSDSGAGCLKVAGIADKVITELTNDRLWRWDAAKQALIAP